MVIVFLTQEHLLRTLRQAKILGTIHHHLILMVTLLSLMDPTDHQVAIIVAVAPLAVVVAVVVGAVVAADIRVVAVAAVAVVVMIMTDIIIAADISFN
jgi:hypothetical protein